MCTLSTTFPREHLRVYAPPPTGRVYVESAEGKLVGVVSIRDVCAEVLARCDAPAGK
jgi:hypothetical protein